MDRRAKKLEKKRKGREQARKKANALAARKPSEMELLARTAAREEFGPCFVSAGWDDEESPELVSLVVTRRLPSGHLVPGTVLVDRTCLGIKNGIMSSPMRTHELEEFVDRMGAMHGGMVRCEPLVVQSIVFHAIDYARALGFEPDPDFPAALFGPRPSELLTTPWSAAERPWYIPGPSDDALGIMHKLARAVGSDGFDVGVGDARAGSEEDAELVHSPLECTVSRDQTRLRILIYRGRDEALWTLEVEDDGGGSTVWDDGFESDQAAQEAALLAIEQDGVESFVVRDAAPSEVVAPVVARQATIDSAR